MSEPKNTPSANPDLKLSVDDSKVEDVYVLRGNADIAAKQGSEVKGIRVGQRGAKPPAPPPNLAVWIPLIVGVLAVIGTIAAAIITKKC